MKSGRFFRLSAELFFLTLSWTLIAAIPAVANDILRHIDAGDKAFAAGKFAEADTHYAGALAGDPSNYRVLKSAAEAKIKLGQYKEADALLDRILAMPVGTGRDVTVYLEDSPEPLEAELVDETVVTPEKGQDNMRHYLDLNLTEPVPHYRLFLKKPGQLRLIPKSQARIKYTSIASITLELVKNLKEATQKQLIAASGGAAPSAEDMVSIKSGCFKMGSRNGSADEQPVHEVCLSPFKLDKREVSQKNFQAVMGTNPSQLPGADLPADSVTWFEATEYCHKLGKRLPTEAEWEYAARAGTATDFYWGNEVQGKEANFCDSACELNIRVADKTDGFKTTAPVGSFPPNPWGLHDIAGNVSEWVADWMEENSYQWSPRDNPTGSDRDQSRKGFRGGSWDMEITKLRSASRNGVLPDYRFEGIGFRCAANP